MTGTHSLGVGLGYREPFRSELFLRPQAVDFLEVTADHFLGGSREKWRELDLLADHFTLVPHGLNLSLGSAEGIDQDYLETLAKLVERINPPWWSEHIAFTRAGGVAIGHLAPLPFTREAVATVQRNVEQVRRRIDVPLILENITYTVQWPEAEMSEGQFVREIGARTGCGLLLDVTNLYTNAMNHGEDPLEFLAQFPLDQVVQLHLAGGHEHEGVLVDSHSQPAAEEVWDLLELVLQRAPVRGLILERDENLPPFAEVERELERARELGKRYGRWG